MHGQWTEVHGLSAREQQHNLRDYAEEQRNSAIQRANERAQKIDDDAVDEVDSDDLQAGSSDAPFNFAGGAPVDKQECQTLEAGL